MNKYIIYAIIAAGVVTAVTLFFWHYNSLIDSKIKLEKEVASLEAELSGTRIALDEQRQVMFTVIETSQRAQEIVRRTDDLFAEHDFQRLLNAKQNLIIDRANNATAGVNELLECLTIPRETRGSDSTTCTNSP